MSEQTEEPTGEQVEQFGEKLIAFTRTLTPRERELFASMMGAARAGLRPEVAGYDSGDVLSDLATKIKWDTLTDISINPPPPSTDPGPINA